MTSERTRRLVLSLGVAWRVAHSRGMCQAGLNSRDDNVNKHRFLLPRCAVKVLRADARSMRRGTKTTGLRRLCHQGPTVEAERCKHGMPRGIAAIGMIPLPAPIANFTRRTRDNTARARSRQGGLFARAQSKTRTRLRIHTSRILH